MRISDWSSDVCSSDLCPILVKKGQRKCVNIGGLLAENCLGARRFCASARSGTEVAPLAAPGVGALCPGIDGRVLERRGEAGRAAVRRAEALRQRLRARVGGVDAVARKSTRLNSSH